MVVEPKLHALEGNLGTIFFSVFGLKDLLPLLSFAWSGVPVLRHPQLPGARKLSAFRRATSCAISGRCQRGTHWRIYFFEPGRKDG